MSGSILRFMIYWYCTRLDTDLSELAELGGSGKRAAMAQHTHQYFSCCLGLRSTVSRFSVVDSWSWEKFRKLALLALATSIFVVMATLQS